MAKQNLTIREKFGFGLGDTASNIVYQAVINILLYFYTDVYGIEAAAAGTLLLVVRIFDAIIDPDDGRDRRPHALEAWPLSSVDAVGRHTLRRAGRGGIRHARRRAWAPSWSTRTSAMPC